VIKEQVQCRAWWAGRSCSFFDLIDSLFRFSLPFFFFFFSLLCLLPFSLLTASSLYLLASFFFGGGKSWKKGAMDD
jgi:hypothetical protein